MILALCNCVHALDHTPHAIEDRCVTMLMAGDGSPPQIPPSMQPSMPIGAPPMNHAGMSQGKCQHQQGGHEPGDFDNKFSRTVYRFLPL